MGAGARFEVEEIKSSEWPLRARRGAADFPIYSGHEDLSGGDSTVGPVTRLIPSNRRLTHSRIADPLDSVIGLLFLNKSEVYQGDHRCTVLILAENLEVNVPPAGVVRCVFHVDYFDETCEDISRPYRVWIADPIEPDSTHDGRPLEQFLDSQRAADTKRVEAACNESLKHAFPGFFRVDVKPLGVPLPSEGDNLVFSDAITVTLEGITDLKIIEIHLWVTHVGEVTGDL